VPLVFHPNITKKLAEKHGVSEGEVRQCFANMEGEFVEEIRQRPVRSIYMSPPSTENQPRG
jgi:hypothetical protein